MTSGYAETKPADQLVAGFLSAYHRNWQANFPGLNKRAHWHVIFSARLSGKDGVSCRVIHRALYGFYGTDIRTCIERIKDCESDGFVRVFDGSEQPCPASTGSLIGATEKLCEHFDRHCRETINEICSVFGEPKRRFAAATACGDAVVAAVFQFFGAYDQKWRETAESIVRQKRLTPAYHDDAMDHLVTYQYWAIVMLLWSAGCSNLDRAEATALVIDEINSKMWDALRLGHLAIKERVDNLIRWGFFAEKTIKKHKAVALTPFASDAISKGLTETKPLLEDLYGKLTPRPELISAISA
jgi:hypothetical protein